MLNYRIKPAERGRGPAYAALNLKDACRQARRAALAWRTAFIVASYRNGRLVNVVRRFEPTNSIV